MISLGMQYKLNTRYLCWSLFIFLSIFLAFLSSPACSGASAKNQGPKMFTHSMYNARAGACGWEMESKMSDQNDMRKGTPQKQTNNNNKKQQQ